MDDVFRGHAFGLGLRIDGYAVPQHAHGRFALLLPGDRAQFAARASDRLFRRGRRRRRGRDHLSARRSLTLAHLLHQLLVIPTTLGEHLRADCVDFSNHWIFE
jgi:hypothetical protein